MTNVISQPTVGKFASWSGRNDGSTRQVHHAASIGLNGIRVSSFITPNIWRKILGDIDFPVWHQTEGIMRQLIEDELDNYIYENA